MRDRLRTDIPLRTELGWTFRFQVSVMDEEIIEEKRAALPPGGTPVTPETFKAAR